MKARRWRDVRTLLWLAPVLMPKLLSAAPLVHGAAPSRDISDPVFERLLKSGTDANTIAERRVRTDP
jgi:hypothetical protein